MVRQRSAIRRGLIAAMLGACGVVFGTAGTVAHSLSFGGLPVGLLIAAVSCIAYLLSVRLLATERWYAIVAGLAMLAAVVIFSGRGPGGSILVPQAAEGEFPLGLVWTGFIGVTVLVIVSWPRFQRPLAKRPSQART